MTIPAVAEADHAHPAFRIAEKHFKAHSDPSAPAFKGPAARRPLFLPSLVDVPAHSCRPVLDLSRPAAEEDDEVYQAGWWGPRRVVRGGRPRELGVRPDKAAVPVILLRDGRKGYIVSPGCVLIPGYLDPRAQLAFLHDCLAVYTRNRSSLSLHYLVPPDLYGAYMRTPDLVVQPRHTLLSDDEKADMAARHTKGRRLAIATRPDDAGRLPASEETRAEAVVSTTVGARAVRDLMREVRWANLGYDYDWTIKAYDFSKPPPPFPRRLRELCRQAVGNVPWDEVFDDGTGATWANDYEPETGIVNFYQLSDTLMGHVDRAELDPSRPLVSLSVGHAAVLLVGTSSRDDPPMPIILRSGDILIMAGPGRQAYHGVPRVLEGSLPTHFAVHDDDVPDMAAAKEWIATGRINVNTRQVFPPGISPPASL